MSDLHCRYSPVQQYQSTLHGVTNSSAMERILDLQFVRLNQLVSRLRKGFLAGRGSSDNAIKAYERVGQVRSRGRESYLLLTL
jgi:hypothetical protein